MRLFKHVVIETNSFCDRKCIFCPKYKDKNWNKKTELPIETIHKIVNELKDYGFDKVGGARIELALYNEPTFDKRLPEIVEYIHNNLPKVHIFFNTNGDYYTSPEQYIKLFDKGLRGIEINIYDESRRKFLTNIYNDVRRLYGEDKFNNSLSGYGKNNYLIASSNKEKVSFLLMDKVDFGNLKTIHKIRNKAGIIDWIPEIVNKIENPIPMVCGFPFRYFVIRATGNVILCCDDYNSEIKYGNMNDSNVHIKNIWEGERIDEIRKKLLRRDRNFYPCDVCDNRITYRPHFIYRNWKELIPEGMPPMPKIKKIKSKSTKNEIVEENIIEINPATGRKYSPIIGTIRKILLEADGKILIEDAAKRLLERHTFNCKDNMKHAKSLFSSVANKYGVPTKVTKTENGTFVELIKEESK